MKFYEQKQILSFEILSSSKIYWWHIGLITVVQNSPTLLTAQSGTFQASSWNVVTEGAAFPLQKLQDTKHDLSNGVLHIV